MKRLYIAVCGSLPCTMERLARRHDVRCVAVQDGRELRNQLMDIDGDPFEMALVESAPGSGLYPLYFPTAEGECSVFLIGDPPDDAVMDALMKEIERLLLEKWRQMEPPPRPAKKDMSTLYRLREGVEVIERDGTPGLRLGERERWAGNPVQAWLIGLLRERSWTTKELEAKMAAEKAEEIDQFLAELWTGPDETDGWEVLKCMKDMYAEHGEDPAILIPCLALTYFYEDFRDFLR